MQHMHHRHSYACAQMYEEQWVYCTHFYIAFAKGGVEDWFLPILWSYDSGSHTEHIYKQPWSWLDYFCFIFKSDWEGHKTE